MTVRCLVCPLAAAVLVVGLISGAVVGVWWVANQQPVADREVIW